MENGVKRLRVPTRIYSRTVGYYAAVQDMHIGKRQEVGERVMYDIPDVVRRQVAADSLAVAEARKPDVGTPAADGDWMDIYPANAPDENGAHTVSHRTIGGKGVTARTLAVSHD